MHVVMSEINDMTVIKVNSSYSSKKLFFWISVLIIHAITSQKQKRS